MRNKNDFNHSEKISRQRDVLANGRSPNNKPGTPYRIGQSLAWVYKAESLGLFPKRVRTGQRSVAWRGGEVQAWIDSREVA